MSLLNILHFPDSRLRNRAQPVTVVDAKVRKLIDDMFETMYDAPGIGLAAIQVDVPLRVITLDISAERNEPIALINPQILDRRGELETEEGCLSVPGYYDTVERAEWIRYQALDQHGKAFDREAQDLLAVCIQHEIDHLDGRLFVDYLSNLKRQRIRKKLERQQREEA